jgi:hypothetical protein
MSLAAIDLSPGEVPPLGTDAMTFQYWPEQIQDDRGAGWGSRRVPGASHPIYQWTSGQERPLKFTAVFTADMDPGRIPGTRFPGADSIPAFEGVRNLNPRRNLDPRSAVQWLRYFTYARYPENSTRIYEPPKLLLIADGLHLSVGNSGDAIRVILQDCPVVYEQCFPSGFPKIVVMELEFVETVQYGGRVRYIGRGNGSASFALARRYPLRVRGQGR